jgi:hypothetical protein
MASTYKYQDVFNLIRGQFSLAEEDIKAVAICNMANERIWNYGPFRQTLAKLRPFCLTPYKQDYGAPQVAVPSDFAGFHLVYLTRTSTVPPSVYELSTRKDIRKTHVVDFASFISYDPATQTFRLDRPAPANVGGHEWVISGDYKKNPTKVTAATMGTTLLPWDDRHLAGVTQVFRWAAAVATGSSKVGELYQMADFEIERMARDEGFELGDPSVAPSSPLVAEQAQQISLYPLTGGW